MVIAEVVRAHDPLRQARRRRRPVARARGRPDRADARPQRRGQEHHAVGARRRDRPDPRDDHVAGQDAARAPRSARAKVGFADQPPALYEFFTVAEHVGFVAEARGAARAPRDVLEQLGLARDRDRPCRELSFGMRQRVGLAAALVGPVELVLLDETLNGLDPHAVRAARAPSRRRRPRRGDPDVDPPARRRRADVPRILILDKGKLIADQRGAELDALIQGARRGRDFYVSLIADEGPT